MALQNLQQLAMDNITFTAFANETISGGQFVKATGANDVVTASGFASTLADGEMTVMKMDASTDDELVVGIALDTATSGNPVTIATRGIYIVAAQDAVTAGTSLSPSNDTDAFCNSVTITGDGEEEFKIGRALTGASASGTFLVMSLNI